MTPPDARPEAMSPDVQRAVDQLIDWCRSGGPNDVRQWPEIADDIYVLLLSLATLSSSEEVLRARVEELEAELDEVRLSEAELEQACADLDISIENVTTRAQRAEALLAQAVEALEPFLPISIRSTPDYAELTFGEHQTQAMTVAPDEWLKLNTVAEALRRSQGLRKEDE